MDTDLTPKPAESASAKPLGDASKKTPDQTVADSIVEGLLAAALVTAEDASNLSKKIATGQVSASDWSVMIKFGANTATA